MHSLAILVVWKFLGFGRPEVTFYNFCVFLKNFQVPQLFARECWNAETPYLGPNGFARQKFGQGLPPIKALGKILGENGRDRLVFATNARKFAFISQSIFIRFEPKFVHALLRQCWAILWFLCEPLRALWKKLWALKVEKLRFLCPLATFVAFLTNFLKKFGKTPVGNSS